MGCALGTWGLPHSLPTLIFGKALSAGTWRWGAVLGCLRIQDVLPWPARSHRRALMQAVCSLIDVAGGS